MCVQRYFDSSKKLGEENSVIFINWEIHSGAEDARICFTSFNDNEGYQGSILMIMIIFEILLFI